MTKAIVFTVLVVSALIAKERDFLITILKPFDSVLFDVTQNYDGSISAVGYSNNYKQTTTDKTYISAFDYLSDVSDNPFGKKAILVNISPTGKINFEKFARIDDFNEAVAVLKTPQNGYFLGGYTFNGSLLLAKLDARGNTLFVKKFGTKNYDRMNNLVKLSDGGVLAVGSSTTSRDTFDPMFRTGLGLNDIFLTRFDKNGRMLWSKKYGTQYDDRGIDAAEAYDGSIVVVAATRYEKNHDVTLMRIGENGNKIWLRHFKLKKLLIPRKIIRLHDNNFLLSLTEKNEAGRKSIRLIKFDLQKNVLIDNTLQTHYESQLNDIKEYANGTIIGVGEIKDRYNTDALAMILDENLEMLCQKHFGGENIDLFHSVAILRDSDTLAVGLTIPESSQVKNMYTAKIKPNCTLAKLPINSTAPQKAKTSSLYEELRKLVADEISSGEISLDKNLEITLDSKELLFNVGAYKLTKKQKLFLNTLVKKLVPFMRAHRNDIQALEIIGHTSSEWEKSDFSARYNNNMQLSLKRAYSVSCYIFDQQNEHDRKMLSELLKDSGWSFAKKIEKENKEDKPHSRRIVISVVTK